MHYDALATAAVADEWRRVLVGGRIDKVFQPDAWSLAILVRSQGQNRQVFASANPRFARAHLVQERKLGSGFDEPSAFVMLLRKHLEGARILSVDQPPLERIVQLVVGHAATPPRRLIIELLGRQSNAILVDEAGLVMGALRLVSAEMSRTRVILPHQPYAPPPPAVDPSSGRLDPRVVAPTELAAALSAHAGQRVPEVLPRIVTISPTAAREAAFRASSDEGSDVTPEALAVALHELCVPLSGEAKWMPTVARADGVLVAFAPYELRHLASSATLEPSASMSLAVERFFAPREAADDVEARRARLRAIVRAPLEKAERRLAALRCQRQDAEAQLPLRHQGELLLTYAPDVSPGQREVVLDDYETGRPLVIAVDSAQTAVQNAQRLFRRYARAKRAVEALGPQVAGAELDEAFGRQALVDLALCDSAAELARLEEELRNAGYLEQRGRTAAKRGPKHRLARKGERRPAPAADAPVALRLDGFDVLYGKTSAINDALTFRVAARQDLWLHAKGVPGSHVVIRSNGREVPADVLTLVAGLAAYLSDARAAGKAAVDYTSVSNVRRQPGGRPGLVYYVGERTVQVVPTPPERLAADPVGQGT